MFQTIRESPRKLPSEAGELPLEITRRNSRRGQKYLNTGGNEYSGRKIRGKPVTLELQKASRGDGKTALSNR